MRHSKPTLNTLFHRLRQAVACLSAALFLSACTAPQDHYYEHNTVHFSNSGSITETRSANYPPHGYSGGYGTIPINAAIAVSGNQAAGAVIIDAMPHQPPAPYPQSTYRTYQSGNTSITRGTYYPSNCQQRYHRGGNTYYRSIPCPN